MIAYFILVHRYPEQFKRLFAAIYDPECCYVVHTDKRSDPQLNADIAAFLADYPNASLLRSKNALWGGYSLVDAELRGIEEALRMNPTWEFFINLSGQDFPLKTPAEIRAFLRENRGKDLLKVADQRQTRPTTLNRLEEYCVEWGDRVIRTPFRRRFLRGVTPYIGNQWMILTRAFCAFVTTSPEVRPFKRFYRHTFIADEGFFQTVIMNTSYKGTIVNDDMRAIDWVPDGTIKLRPRTFTATDAPFLFASKQLFARKFDETVDRDILELLESHLFPPVPLPVRR